MATATLDGMQTAFGRKERKVRLSCNACGSQKIRCGRQRPKCCRCTRMGLDCEYSMSMRTGERPRFMLSSARSNYADSPYADSPAMTDTPQSTTSAMLQQLGDLSQDLQQDIDWMFLEMPELYTPVDQASYLDNGTSHDFGISVETDDPGYSRECTSIPTTSIQDYGTGSVLHSHGCYNEERYQTESQAQPSTTHSDMRIPQRRRVHDCLTAALQIIADFHVSTRGCPTAAQNPVCPTYDECSADQSAREIRAVLSDNSGALQKLGSILDCKCFLRKEVQAMVYLAIDKIVCWYVAILGEDDQSSPGIAEPPSIIGNHCLDDEAQRLISAQLVLEQLKEHLNPLINRVRLCHSLTKASSELKPVPWNLTV